ncbi:hypothetical protein [Rhodanobacter umsongensis]
MNRKVPWKTDLEHPTGVETLADAELREAALAGDEDAIATFREREIRRREKLPDHYTEITQTRGGTQQVAFVIEPYYRRRPSLASSARKMGAIAASVMAVVSLIVGVALGHPTVGRVVGECIADVLIVTGTFFTARGAFLGISGTRWLHELACQHRLALNQQINPRQSDVTRQLMHALDDVKDGFAEHGNIAAALEKARENLSKQLNTSSSGFSEIQILTNRDIAELLLDASAGAVLGSVLIIGGTLVLAVLALRGG